SVLDDREFIFGHLPPGESRTWTVEIDIPKDTETRHELVKFQLSDERQNYGKPRTASVQLRSRDRPKFAFSYSIHDDSGDGVLQVGESIRFETFVGNRGRAASSKARVFLRNHSGDDLYLETGRAQIEGLKPKSVEPVDFKFRIKNRPDDGNVDLQVGVYDSTFREYVEKKFEVPFGEKNGSASDASGTATIGDQPVPAYPGTDEAYSPLAKLQAGSRLPVVGRTDGWFEVDLGRQHGWVRADVVEYEAGGSTEPPSSIQWMAYESPAFDIQPETRTTSSSTVELSGSVSDNTSIKDYYTYVYHRENSSSEVQSRKVDYRSVGQPTAELTQKIPLFEGMNRISVVARDEQMMTSQETIYVYRK
ncbi:MAG: hypothetical protein ABEL76_07820, partial [Bradymonadaceae bacterium]